MVDIVIPLGWGSVWQNNELRYCLRSVEKHLKNVGNVFIVCDVTGLPSFLQGVIHIVCPDMSNVAASNSTKKVLKACDDSRLSQNFLLFNDDFFLLRDFDTDNFPCYYKGFLNEKETSNQAYPHSKKITAIMLKVLKKEKLQYDIHFPMMFDKTKFIEIAGMVNWNNGFLIRSLYGNILEIPAELKKDCKFSNKRTLEELNQLKEGNSFCSIGNGAINATLKQFLQQQFPLKSKWEK